MLSDIIHLSSKCSLNESSKRMEHPQKTHGGFLLLDSKKCSNPSSVINVNFPLTNYTPPDPITTWYVVYGHQSYHSNRYIDPYENGLNIQFPPPKDWIHNPTIPTNLTMVHINFHWLNHKLN